MHEFLMDIFELSEAQQALIMFGSMVLMIMLAVPIPIAVAIGTAIGYFMMMDLNLVQVALSMYTGVEPFPLVTVPLFVFAGSLMEQVRRQANCKHGSVNGRKYTGSLGLVTVLGCAFFAALSGSGPATTAVIGADYDSVDDQAKL